MAAAPASAAPASQFGMPGITRLLETKENNDGVVATLSQTNGVQVTGLIPFKQTDVIYGWRMNVTHAVTLAAGGGAITVSPLFPDNYLGNFQLNMQNQFNTIQVASGYDLMLFDQMRPYRKSNRRNAAFASPQTGLYSVQSNLITSGSYNNASTTIKRAYWLPAGLHFDEYIELDKTGNPLSRPIQGFVSPQYMAGTARIVTPVINLNPGFGSKADLGPYTTSGGTPTFSGTSTFAFRRVGLYQPQGLPDSPPVFNWQYVRKTQQVAINGVSSANINVPFNGQILGLYVRLFDPSSGAGVPIDLSNVTECDIVYGSGLYRYQDVPLDMQQRLYEHIGVQLGTGVMAWDFARDERDNITNRYALNTLNTSGIQVQLTFSGTQSATAYAIIGVEGLQYVEI